MTVVGPGLSLGSATLVPVQFRVDASSKSDLRNHCAIVQPRLYDSAMATQITLSNTEPHGFDSFQGHSYEKFSFVVPGRSGLALVTLDETNGLASLTSRCVRARPISSLGRTGTLADFPLWLPVWHATPRGMAP